MTLALNILHVKHNHAGENALRDLSFQVPSGALFGLVGADGAGKSTLFRLLATLLPLQAGSITIQGLDTQKNRQAIRTSIGYMPQRFSLYSDLSVLENLQFAAEIMDIPRPQLKTRIGELLEFSRLTPAQSRRAGRLSGGMKQKLALCCALVRKPQILLLDEPTVGVDPVTRKDFWEMLALLRDQGTTTLVSTPYMDEAELCSEVLLLHEGRMIDQGSPQQLCAPLENRLYAILGTGSLQVPAHLKVEAPLENLYTQGGELRALAQPHTPSEIVLQTVQKYCPQASRIQLAPARVEDVLLQKLARESSHGL